MGCLSAPFKLLGFLVLLIVLAIGWLYRDRLADEVHRVMGSSSSPASAVSTGRPGSSALISAQAKIDSLNGWRADSVVLSAAEVASLIGTGLNQELRDQLDSVRVELLDGSVKLSARLATARLPKELIGPLAFALRPHEPIEAAGPIEVVGPRKAEWSVRSFRVRDFPIPRDAVPRLLVKAFGDSTKRAVPLRIPPGVRAIRVRPSGATLLGAPRP